MMAQQLFFFCLSAVVTATIIAALLALIPALHPQPSHYWQRFGFAFVRWAFPVWCALELLFWLITKRWVPWMP